LKIENWKLEIGIGIGIFKTDYPHFKNAKI
jgi:hypothetical protein